ncbi:hypothetical protein GW17_00060870 [Ensete ventricosum]|nr:hypothetical protein GW17_00060870 [Ensete ventricosum]
MVGTESPGARLRARLLMVGTESPGARLRARLVMVGTESPRARLRARLSMVGTESPWARLRARLLMVGIESPRARLRARLSMVRTESPGGMSQKVEDFSFPDGTQLVAVSGGFLVGVLGVGYKGDPSVVYGLLSTKSGVSRVLLSRSFPTEWTSRTVSSSVSVLLADETELVKILQGILFVSRGVKDMNEAWLAEAGLSPTPRGMFFPFLYQVRVLLNHTFCCAEMFNLGKMKSDGGAGSGLMASSVASAPTTGDAGGSTIEKHPSFGARAGLRKCLLKVAAEQPTDASGSTVMTSADKGKGTMELEEVPERGYTMRELYKVEDQAGADRYFTSIMMRLKCINSEDPLVPRWSTISRFNPFWTKGPLSGEYLRGALHPTLLKQVYECSSEELINRVYKSIVWAGIGQELAATVEWRVKELEGEIESIRTELESHRSQQRELEQEAVAFLEAELKAEGQKAVAAYKASRGFEFGLEKMGRGNYEFGYQVALERLRGKHPDITIKQDPFAECFEDANVEMDLDQPFDNDTPSEKLPTLVADLGPPED